MVGSARRILHLGDDHVPHRHPEVPVVLPFEERHAWEFH